MPETNIGTVTVADIDSVIEAYSVDSATTDGPDGVDEFRWQMDKWPEYLGYYKSIPELQTAVDAKSVWTIGAGFEADEPTMLLLGSITGNGKDSFNSILMNGVRVYTIGGDSFSEIIRDNDGVLVNLKPLDPSTMVVVTNKQGRIIRYEQTSKKAKIRDYKPEEIFHLSRKRLADEQHGISVIPSVEWIILARNEAMADWKKVLHRNVSPLQIHYLDTDDQTKIDAYKTKADAAKAGGENLYVPTGTVKIEVIQSQLNQAASPLQWINQLNDYFFQAVNVPQIIIGNAKEFTDASAKIVYLAFEQSVKSEQLYIEEQVLAQLNIEIALTFPATLENDAVTGYNEQNKPRTSLDSKEGALKAGEPNDTQAGMEGQT